jgi:ATP-dependent DNA helicase RecG
VATPIIDKLDIDGSLDEQIDTVQKFILRNIALKASIQGTKRIDQYEYPEEALRELVANAVIHRDYMITETYAQVNIFANRIEISNPGNLPPGVTIENIKDSQFSRNEVIASILKDMDYLEEYGRGIDIVFSKMREWNLLEPIFKNMSNTFRVVLLGEALKDLNERQVVIWNNLQDKRQITARECKEMFPEVSRATVNVDLNKLVERGLIVPKGSSFNTYYEPQY